MGKPHQERHGNLRSRAWELCPGCRSVPGKPPQGRLSRKGESPQNTSATGIRARSPSWAQTCHDLPVNPSPSRPSWSQVCGRGKNFIPFNSSDFRGFFPPYEGNWSLFFTAHPPTSKKPTEPQNSIFIQNLGMIFQRIKVSMWLLTTEKLGQERCQVDKDRIQKKLKCKGN